MARRNTRASSTAGPVPDDEDVRQLDQARQQNDQKLKSRFERIFRKYEHNFEGVGDEIDIHSGEIVVDNGHLQHMRDEADPGKSASTRFVRTFQERLEHEEASEDGGDGDGSEGEEEDDSEASGSSDGGDDESNDSQSLIEPFRALTRPPPRLAQLLVGGSKVEEDTDDQTSQDPSLDDGGSGTSTPTGLLEQIPALQDSMSALTGRSRRSAMDTNAIQALGTTIANELAQLMAGSSKHANPSKHSKHSKKRKRESQPMPRRATDPVWDFPDIANHNNRHKRKRSPRPVVPPQISSPPAASPGQRSLWAPEGSRQPKRLKQAATPSLRRLRSSVIPSSAVRGLDLRRCVNCSLTNSSTWEVGPDGGDLCASCGKYYDYHGRMKPFDSPSPSVEASDSEGNTEEDMIPDMFIGEPLMTSSAPAVAENRIEEPLSVPQHRDHVPIPPPTQDTHAETIAVQTVSNHVLPEHSRADRVTPTLTMTPTEEEDPGGLIITEMATPKTYPANTSRQILPTPRGHSYTAEEDALIIKVREQDDLPWHVAALHFPDRSLYTIQNRYTRMLRNTECPGRDLFNAQRLAQQEADAAIQLTTPTQELNWSEEQDELLLSLREEKGLEWIDISSVLPGHSAQSVQARYEELVQAAELIRKERIMSAHKPWNPQEDALIVRLKEVDKLAWHHVAQRLVDRSAQAIQKRYSRWLVPEKRKRAPTDPTKGSMEQVILEADPELAEFIAPEWKPEPPYQPAEDELIKVLVKDAKPCDWEQVATHLPNRSIRSVYRRYRTHIKEETAPPEPESIQPETVQPDIGPPADATKGRAWRTYSPRHPSQTRRTDAPPNSGYLERDSSAAQGTATSEPEQLGPGSRNPWVPAEDNIIMQLKASHNASWEDIALRLPGRSVRAIAQRFTELLRAVPIHQMTHDTGQAVPAPSAQTKVVPQLVSMGAQAHRRYTGQEDELVSRLRAENMTWERMASYFANRTPGSLKEHWHTILRPKPRKSLPAPASASAGLLRTALNNSRRRSDAHPGTHSASTQACHSTGLGNAEDPIVFVDDVEMAAASQQLFEEFRSSAVQSPAADSQIDPQLLEMDRATTNESGIQRLMSAARKFAAEQDKPQMIQQISQILQSNPEDPRLQQLLELTARDGSHTPAELEWAFEAFAHSYDQPRRIEQDRSTASRVAPVAPEVSMRDKGKGKARELDANPRPPPVPAPAHAFRERERYMPANLQSQPQEAGQSTQSVVKPTFVATPASQTFAQPAQPALAPPTRSAASHAGTGSHAVSESRVVPAGSNGHSPEHRIGVRPAIKPSQPVPSQVPVKQVARNPVASQTKTTINREHEPTSVHEESLAAPQCPKHTFAELIHMAFKATRLNAMHPINICAWVENNFEYYRTIAPSLRSSILMELNSKDDFEQCGTGIDRPWRAKVTREAGPSKSAQARSAAQGAREAARAASRLRADEDDVYTMPCTDDDAGDDVIVYDDAEDTIAVKPAPKRRAQPRGKRTTDSAEDVQDYTPVEAALQVPIARKVPTRGRLSSVTKSAESLRTVSTPKASELDLTVEIADSDGGDELSSSPAQKPLPQMASSEKKVRFVETVEVRGPARSSTADAPPSTRKSAPPAGASDTREPGSSSSSPAKMREAASTKASGRKAEAAVPSSSPVFMKPALPSHLPSSKSKPSSTPISSVSTPFPRAKSCLTQLRRESSSTAVTAPETPKTNWPRRHSTPTAIFSHRSSPALERGVMHDRFGFGRKRVVQTPVRELMKRKDMEEDELA